MVVVVGCVVVVVGRVVVVVVVAGRVLVEVTEPVVVVVTPLAVVVVTPLVVVVVAPVVVVVVAPLVVVVVCAWLGDADTPSTTPPTRSTAENSRNTRMMRTPPGKATVASAGEYRDSNTSPLGWGVQEPGARPGENPEGIA